jgi:Rrf2 family protein
MSISHKVDYGIRLMAALASANATEGGTPVPAERLAREQAIPGGSVDDILRTLRNGGLVRSHRGPDGGWTLARSAADITAADVIRAIDGPLASVRGVRPHQLSDIGVEEPFVSLWVAVRASLRSVLEAVTIADLANGSLPRRVRSLVATTDAWESR